MRSHSCCLFAVLIARCTANLQVCDSQKRLCQDFSCCGGQGQTVCTAPTFDTSALMAKIDNITSVLDSLSLSSSPSKSCRPPTTLTEWCFCPLVADLDARRLAALRGSHEHVVDTATNWPSFGPASTTVQGFPPCMPCARRHRSCTATHASDFLLTRGAGTRRTTPSSSRTRQPVERRHRPSTPTTRCATQRQAGDDVFDHHADGVQTPRESTSIGSEYVASLLSSAMPIALPSQIGPSRTSARPPSSRSPGRAPVGNVRRASAPSSSRLRVRSHAPTP